MSSSNLKPTDNMTAWMLKLPPDLLDDMKAAAEADGFTNHSEWARVQLRAATRRVLTAADAAR